MIIPHDWLPFLYPLAALGMLMSVLLDLRVSVVVTIAFALIVLLSDPKQCGACCLSCFGQSARGRDTGPR